MKPEPQVFFLRLTVLVQDEKLIYNVFFYTHFLGRNLDQHMVNLEYWQIYSHILLLLQ